VRTTLIGGNQARTTGAPIGGGGGGGGGFGRVTVRTSRADGQLTGVRAGRTGSFAGGGWSAHSGSSFGFARSGSLGRTGGGGFSA
jgi:hypothetical protein